MSLMNTLGQNWLGNVPMKLLAGPVLIIMILSMMILPLPPFALDMFFTFNIALALMVLLALMVVGGDIIHNFSVALMIGVLVGTYSSIFVASNILMAMNISREDLMPPETEEVDDRP